MRPMRDPAPSRLAYKLNRLMLRRGIRTFLRFGLPVLIVTAGAAFWASDETRREEAWDRVAELRRQIEERPEFMVKMMSVEAASSDVARDIRAVLSLDFPVSSFDLNLDQLRETIEDIDAVREASVRIRTGGILEIAVAERVPAAVWRSDDALVLLDATGHRVATIDARTQRPDLPLIAGQGAGEAIEEALELYANAGPIRDQLRGFLRVGQRRWDIILSGEIRVMLPEEGAATALQKAIALDKAQDLFAKDISVVDFRNTHRPVVRLGQGAMGKLYETEWSAND